jgi:hypothetical protein
MKPVRKIAAGVAAIALIAFQAQAANLKKPSAPGRRGLSGIGASATIEAEPTLRAIQAGSFASREQLLEEINQRVEANAGTLASLKQQARDLGGESAAELKSALKDADQQEKQLRKSLKALRAANAERWEGARMEVATDYSAYVNAVSRAQMCVAPASSPALEAANAGQPAR